MEEICPLHSLCTYFNFPFYFFNCLNVKSHSTCLYCQPRIKICQICLIVVHSILHLKITWYMHIGMKYATLKTSGVYTMLKLSSSSHHSLKLSRKIFKCLVWKVFPLPSIYSFLSMPHVSKSKCRWFSVFMTVDLISLFSDQLK